MPETTRASDANLIAYGFATMAAFSGFVVLDDFLPTMPTPMVQLATVCPTLAPTANPLSRKASATLTPAQVFDTFSTANSAPGATFFVDVVNGSNLNDGLTDGTAFRSIHTAITAANSAGVPTKIFVDRVGASSVYSFGDNFAGSGTSVKQTVDIAFVARGGMIDVHTGSGSGAHTFTEDATYKGMYTTTVIAGTVTQIVNLLDVDPHTRTPRALEMLASADQVKYQPGWDLTDTTLTFRRPDGQVPTSQNTRVLRNTRLLFVEADVNVALLGETDYDGWNLMGGAVGKPNNVLSQNYGSIHYEPSSGSLPGSYKCLVLDNVKMSHGWRGLAVNSLHGLVYMNRCGGANAFTDVFNLHNDKRTSSELLGVLVDCWTRKTGVFGRDGSGNQNGTCQGLTLHDNDNCMAISIGCDFEGAAGGDVRNIGGSLWMSYRDRFGPDRGDTLWGGGVLPCAVRLDDSGTTAWIFDPVIEGCDFDIVATAGATANVVTNRNLRTGGGGTIQTWAA